MSHPIRILPVHLSSLMALKVICLFLNSENGMIISIDWIFCISFLSPLICGHLITKPLTFCVCVNGQVQSWRRVGANLRLKSDWDNAFETFALIYVYYSLMPRSHYKLIHTGQDQGHRCHSQLSGERDPMIKRSNRAFIFFKVLASQGHSGSTLKERTWRSNALVPIIKCFGKFRMSITTDELLLMVFKHLSTSEILL